MHEIDEQIFESLRALSKKYARKSKIKDSKWKFFTNYMRLIVPFGVFLAIYFFIIVVATWIRIVLEDYKENDFFY